MRGIAWLLVAAMPVLANGTIEVRGGAEGTIALTRHAVHAVLRDQLAEVTVEQEFLSSSPSAVEGIYVFSLPPGASVSDFSMTVDGKTLHGEVVERNKAVRIYHDIVDRKLDPAILEMLDGQTFRARVYPLGADKPVVIRLAYQQLLDDHDGRIEWRYPLSRERLGADDVREIAVTVAVGSAVDLVDVASPSHALEVARIGPRQAKLSWTGRTDAQARDFLLHVRRDPGAIGLTLLGHVETPGEGSFLAILAPPMRIPADEIPPRDVVYVLDTSGSMEGGKLAQAKAALIRGIELLRPGDRFRIVAFSTEVRALHETWMPASDEWKRIARAWVESRKAGGGTAIDEALFEAVRTGDPARLGLVVFLTDGLPTVGERDPRQVAANVKKFNRASMRVFCFGVGFDQGVPFLDEIATSTRACREYVAQGDDLEVVLGRFFDRIQQPALVDLRVDWGDGVTDVYPRPLPDLFAGDRLVIAGRYAKAGPRVVTLHGTRLGEALSFSYEGTLPESGGVEAVARLWARRKIDFLLAEIARHGENAELKNAVVALATRHRVVTPYTAGLVVEDGAPLPDEGAAVGPSVFTENAVEVPFDGPKTTAGIGLGGGGGGGRRRLRAAGYSRTTQNAVELGLSWMRDRQTSDGSYGDVAETSLVLLSFLGAGYTDRGTQGENRYREQVRDGLRWLLTRQREDGTFDDDATTHAQATLAMAEAYGLMRNPRYRKPAQAGLDHLAGLPLPADDVLRAAWTVCALWSARAAGLDVDPDALERARLVFGARSGTSDPTEQAAMLFSRILLGEDPRSSAELRAFMDAVLPHAPRWTAGPQPPVDLWYFGTLAAFQVGGPSWKRWNEALRETVAKGQRGTDAGELAGTWPLGGAPTTELADQAKLNLCLEVYYRYGRVFGTPR